MVANMTAREQLRKACYRTNWIIWGCFFPIMILAFLKNSFEYQNWIIIMGIGMLLMMLAMFYSYHWAVLCPFCSKSLYPVLMKGNNWFVLDDIKACPYCTRLLDEETIA